MYTDTHGYTHRYVHIDIQAHMYTHTTHEHKHTDTHGYTYAHTETCTYTLHTHDHWEHLGFFEVYFSHHVELSACDTATLVFSSGESQIDFKVTSGNKNPNKYTQKFIYMHINAYIHLYIHAYKHTYIYLTLAFNGYRNQDTSHRESRTGNSIPIVPTKLRGWKESSLLRRRTLTSCQRLPQCGLIA